MAMTNEQVDEMDATHKEKVGQAELMAVALRSGWHFDESVRVNFCMRVPCQHCAFRKEMDGTFGNCRLAAIERARAFAKENGINFPDPSKYEIAKRNNNSKGCEAAAPASGSAAASPRNGMNEKELKELEEFLESERVKEEKNYDWACQKNDQVNIEHHAGRMEAYASVENKIKEILEREKNGKQAN